MKKTSSIYIAGHEEYIGSALVSLLRKRGYSNLILQSEKKLNLQNQSAVNSFFRRAKPEYVFLARQKSGGILSNVKYPADYIYENLMIEANVIHGAAISGTKKLLFFGASCMYPQNAKQPIAEDALYLGLPEVTSLPYAQAKLTGVEMCRAYEAQYGMQCVSVVPATVYGPGVKHNPESNHVLTALIGNFYDAVHNNSKEVVVWGSGKPQREFIYVDDFARACVFLMEKSKVSGLYNAGGGEEVSIRELADLVKRASGYRGRVVFDRSKPDGAMRKMLSSKRIHSLGWMPQVKLAEGVRLVYNSHKSNV